MSREVDKRIMIYPNYLDSKKTVAQGRRVPLDKACESPLVVEMDYCVKYLKLPCEIEAKMYSRDWLVTRDGGQGRLRVTLRNDDGTPVNPEVPTRRELYLRIAELVRRHPGRHKRPGQQKSDAGVAGSSTSTQAQGSAGKKKGKKK